MLLPVKGGIADLHVWTVLPANDCTEFSDDWLREVQLAGGATRQGSYCPGACEACRLT